MKTKVLLTGLAMAAFLMTGCKSSKQLPLVSDFVEYELPCGNFDKDTKDYFTGLGTAENINEQNARDAALESAKGQMRRKIGGMAKGLATDYGKIMRGGATQSDVESIVEGEIGTIVERMLNDVEKTCERNGKTSSGTYKAYVAIRVSKEELASNVAKALSENDKLRIEYDREQFRKFAEEYMKGLNEQGK